MMTTVQGRRMTALVTLVSLIGTQAACYNTYFIDKSELKKLESAVEPREVVDVYGDCQDAKQAGLTADGLLVAQADAAPSDTATDAAPAAPTNERPGCIKVPVSTANAVMVKGKDDANYRVTPFNFIMSETQLVSPEYNLLLPLDQVNGAEVKQFSTGKTVATIVGVTAVAVGTFILIALIAPQDGGFN
jgi:hypothetical protein